MPLASTRVKIVIVKERAQACQLQGEEKLWPTLTISYVYNKKFAHWRAFSF